MRGACCKLLVEHLEDRLLPNSFLELLVLFELPFTLEHDSWSLLHAVATVSSSHDGSPLRAVVGKDTCLPLGAPAPIMRQSVDLACSSLVSHAPITIALDSLLGGNDDPSFASWENGAYLTEKYVGPPPYMFAGQPYSGVYEPRWFYNVGATDWVAELDPVRPLAVSATPLICMSNNFFDALTAAYPTWTFGCSPTSLADNSLIVQTYAVYGSPTLVKGSLQVEYDINLQGNPGEGIHWIQVIRNNHKLPEPPGGHGIDDYKVDVLPGSPTPYYDAGGAATSLGFGNNPNRTDGDASHGWFAELYLVQETDVRTVKLWGGIIWGWCNAIWAGGVDCSSGWTSQT